MNRYTILLDTDDVQFGGHGRICHAQSVYHTTASSYMGRAGFIQVHDARARAHHSNAAY